MMFLVAAFTTVSVEMVLVTCRGDDSGEMIRKVVQVHVLFFFCFFLVPII